ncbi:hypothetical protein CFP56_023560 [Quercus suber]|uniref:C-JID domain-containing protein n=2 Tax=Quercus suber TaxID=58331 RepID=A0AAW0K919_QUESU
MMPVYFPALTYLSLYGSNIVAIPESISRFPRLIELEIENCMQLREIQGLPQSIRRVTARNCLSLDPQSSNRLLNLIGDILGLLPNMVCECSRRRDPVSSRKLLHPDISSSYWLSSYEDFEFEEDDYDCDFNDDDYEIRLPGTEIPYWFNHQSIGDSIYFWVGRELSELAVCIVFGLEGQIGPFNCQVYLSINGCERKLKSLAFQAMMSDHRLVFCKPYVELQRLLKCFNLGDRNHAMVVCKISTLHSTPTISPIIKRCGVHVVCCPHKFSNLGFDTTVSDGFNLGSCSTAHNLLNDDLDLYPPSKKMRRS